MRQSIRGFLNGVSPGPNGTGKDGKKGGFLGEIPGKLTRKATVANLMGNAQPTISGQHQPVGPGTGAEDNPENSILDHYSGLLYHDPVSSGTWKDVNLPKKPKTPNVLFASSTQQTLAAGRNINAYRPWGPERKVDPLDALLERSMNNSLSLEIHGEHEDGEYDDDFFEATDHSHSRSSTGKSSRGSRPTSRNGRGGSRKSSNGTHYKDRHASLAVDHQNQNHNRNGKHGGGSKSNNHRHHSNSPHHNKHHSNNNHHHHSGNRSRSHSTESRKGSAGERRGGGRNSPHNCSSITPPRSHNSRTSSAEGNRSRPRSRGRYSDDETGNPGLTVSISQESYLSHEGSSLVTNSLLSPSLAGGDNGENHYDMPPIPSNDESEYGSPVGSPSLARRSHDLNSSSGSPSHSMTKKRSPLVINFIKPPI
jgi:hypothetical protein